MSLTKNISTIPAAASQGSSGVSSARATATDSDWNANLAYHEMGAQHVIHHDELELLHVQLCQLEDLISRISFFGRELRANLGLKS